MAFPATYNIQYYQGDTYQFAIRPKDSFGEVFPVSGTTHNAHFYISPQRGGASVDTIEANVNISDNVIYCTIYPDEGNLLSAGTTYYYDVSIIEIANTDIVYTLLTGSISVTSDITTP